MGRITVSLPDELKVTLTAYANQHDVSASRVVTQALEAFFHGDPTNPPPPTADLAATQHYLTQLIHRLDEQRRSLHQMAIAQAGAFAEIPKSLSEPIPPPPWLPAHGVEHG